MFSFLLELPIKVTYLTLLKSSDFQVKRVESCIANPIFHYWYKNVPTCISAMFRPPFWVYSNRSKMTLNIHSGTENMV